MQQPALTLSDCVEIVLGCELGYGLGWSWQCEFIVSGLGWWVAEVIVVRGSECVNDVVRRVHRGQHDAFLEFA